MRENFFIERENPKTQKKSQAFGVMVMAVFALLIALFIPGCVKEQDVVDNQSNLTVPLSTIIAETFPDNNADTVVINPVIEVSFKSAQDSVELASSTLILKKGTIPVAGTVSYSKTTIDFKPQADLEPDTKYTATIRKNKGNTSEDKDEHSWTFTTGKHRDNNSKLSVVSVSPISESTDVAPEIHPVITFNKDLSSTVKKALTITLLQGTTPVLGSVSYSGANATFTPAVALQANTLYTGTVAYGNKSYGEDSDDDHHDGNNSYGDDDDDDDDHHEGSDENNSSILFTWSLTTKADGVDNSAPTVLSILPAGDASAVAVNIHPGVTFSEAMNSSTINSTTFMLKNGTTAISGTVTYSGTTATFIPSANLEAGTVYTGTIATGAKDLAGNALTSAYIWSFTTAAATDVTPPTVLSVTPLNNAISIVTNSNVTVSFSEAMNSSTINSTTFTLKQGSTTVAGSVSYSGTTGTFNPTSDLAGGTVYTATITTGAKDVAGNSITTSKVWIFTTVASAPVISFANDVMPILQTRCTSCHGATNPRAGISITNYTTVSKLSDRQLDNSGMYPMLGTTAAEIQIIKDWIAAGRINN